jgi:hypothetical protein
VRVPEEAGAGKATVTFSFESWKEGRVAPTTIELPAVPPDAAKKQVVGRWQGGLGRLRAVRTD